MVGTSKLTKADQFTGESDRAEKTLEKRFPTPAHEEALIHSPTLDVHDPGFVAAIRDVKARASALTVVKDVKAATDPGQYGLVSSYGHSVLVEFGVRRDSLTAGARLAPIEAAVKA